MRGSLCPQCSILWPVHKHPPKVFTFMWSHQTLFQDVSCHTQLSQRPMTHFRILYPEVVPKLKELWDSGYKVVVSCLKIFLWFIFLLVTKIQNWALIQTNHNNTKLNLLIVRHLYVTLIVLPLYFLWHGIKKLCNAFKWYVYITWKHCIHVAGMYACRIFKMNLSYFNSE